MPLGVSPFAGEESEDHSHQSQFGRLSRTGAITALYQLRYGTVSIFIKESWNIVFSYSFADRTFPAKDCHFYLPSDLEYLILYHKDFLLSMNRFDVMRCFIYN